jgi:LPS sulfotransferase NodH
MERHAILTNGRSGSNLLVALLNQHPQVCNYGEVLGQWTVPARLRRMLGPVGPSPAWMLETIYESRWVFRVATAIANRARARQGLAPHRKRYREVRSVGIKDFFVQVRMAGVLEYFAAHREIRIVHLHRRDLLQRALSAEALTRTRRAAVRADEEHDWRPPVIDTERLLWKLGVLEQEAREEFAMLEAIAPERLMRVSYEDDFSDDEAIRELCRRLYEFVGVEPIEPEVPHRKIRPTDLASAVANPEEVVAAVAGTRFSGHLPRSAGTPPVPTTTKPSR